MMTTLDDNKQVQLGWLSFSQSIAHDVPEERLADYRACFFAGAFHMFLTVMEIMVAAKSETRDEMEKRLTHIIAELHSYTSQDAPADTDHATKAKEPPAAPVDGFTTSIENV
jgi:hypothetical protein